MTPPRVCFDANEGIPVQTSLGRSTSQSPKTAENLRVANYAGGTVLGADIK
jgi:hypothetical protein